MEQLKKMVPVVAVGLAVAAMSSVDAYAAEEPAQPVDAAPPAEEVKQEAPAPSTEINTAVPVQTPEVSEPPATSETPDTPGTSDPVTTPEETPGPTTTELVVNPGTDAEGGGKGTLTNTTTPGEKTEVTEPTGDPTTTVTTNPDGSTTTTTTTPTETTTTETSSSVIAGEIKDSGAPSQEEIDKVQGSWEQLIQDLIPTEGPDGSQVYTIVETSDPEKSTLTKAELDAVLGVTLTQVGENTYTYTTQDGETVTVTTVAVTDNSTETTTTTWTIQVTKKSETKHESYVLPVSPVTDFISDQNVKDILNQAKQPESGFKEVVTDEKGNITRIVVDDYKTYEFDYHVDLKELSVGGMTVEDIFLMLPANSYTLERETGKIFDSNSHELVFDATQGLVALNWRTVTIGMTVTDSHGSQSGPHYNEVDKIKAEQNATYQAMIDVVIKALQADAGLTQEAADNAKAEVKPNDDGTWTVTITINPKTYIYTVKAGTVKDGGKIDWSTQKVEKQQIATGADISVGFTNEVFNTAYVSGSKVILAGTKKGTLSFTADGKVDITEGSTFEDAFVERVTHSKTSSTVVTRDKFNIVRTYTFTYDVDLTENDIAALHSEFGKNASLSGLKKTTWTITTTSDLNVSKATISSSGNLAEKVQLTDEGYTYTLDNGEILLFAPTGEKGVYSCLYSNKLYVLTETAGGTPEPATDTIIKNLLDPTLVESLNKCEVEFVGNNAIYRDSKGGTFTVEFSNVADKVSLEIFEGEEVRALTEEALKKEIIRRIMTRDGVSEEEAREIYENDIHITNIIKGSSSGQITQSILTAQGVLDYYANATDNQGDLLASLTKQQNTFGPGIRNYTNPHVNVSVKVNLEQGDTGYPMGKGYLLPGFMVSLYETAERLVQDDAFAYLHDYTPVYDEDAGKYVYSGSRSVLGLDSANFYKITGTIVSLLSDEKGQLTTVTSEAEAKQNYPGYVALRDLEMENMWYLGKTAELTVSGYMSGGSCADGGYDIDLGKLILSEEERVVETDDPVITYSTMFFSKPTQLGEVVKSTLTLNKINTTIESSDGDISGSYQITESKGENDLKGEDGDWLYKGLGTGSYESYKTWEAVTEPERIFTGGQYTGKLDYSYVENTTDVKVDASVEKDRDVQVKLDQTSVTTVTGETSTSTTTPAPSNPGGTSGSGSSGSSSRPSSRPSNPSTPTNPSVNIPEEDVPLTNLPNEDVPLTDLPEETPTEQPPVTELPEEDVPLAETPVQARGVSAANTTRISDAQTPLADVPETGDPMLMEAFAAAAAGANALWFSMGKKRRDDAE